MQRAMRLFEQLLSTKWLRNITQVDLTAVIIPTGSREVFMSKSISRLQYRCETREINLLTPPPPMQVHGYLHLLPHSSCVNLLKLPSTYTNETLPENRHPYQLLPDASPRPFSWTHRPRPFRTLVTVFGREKNVPFAAAYCQLWSSSAGLSLSKHARRVFSPCRNSRHHFKPCRRTRRTSHMWPSRRRDRKSWKLATAQSLTKRITDPGPIPLRLCCPLKMKPQARQRSRSPDLSSSCGGMSQRIKTQRIQ